MIDGCGTGGIGFIVGSRAKGFEEGDHTYYTNSTLNAGQTLTLQSGQDTTLKGAQAQGDKVIAKVGGDLHLESQQAIDDYTSKQSSESAGGSVNVMGTPGGSANISFSRDKMDSKYRSVEEQTGLFAGNQGFDISVGKHTQLDGAVISSKADTKNNQLDTGTLGFSDIHNYTEYKVEHQSGGVSTSGGVEGNMLANMGHALAMAGNHSDSAENTTQSAISQGTWTVRDTDNQQQDIAQLSQDTDNAHSTLNKIFDKEKEQNRKQKQQLVGEIGAQIIDLATTVDTIHGTNIAKEESTLNRLSDTAYDDIYQTLSETKDNVTERDVQNYLFQQRLQDYTNQSNFGTGGKYNRAIQAVTAFTQGIMGGNIVTAIANGSAPYLANEVKNQIQGNSVENDIQRTLAHGLVNAGLALAKGENAMAQATGAMTGETVGILSHSLYGKTPEELTETEKQNISAWATLASGIAGGLISDNSAGVANAAQTGKVVVENNWLSTNQLDNFAHQARNCVGDACQKIIRDMVDTNIRQQEEIKVVCSKSPEQCQKQYGYLVEQWNAFDIAIKHLATDKSLPNEFRDYLPAVYMLSMDATGITVEHKWAKRFEAMGLEPEEAGLIAMALPGMINGGSGKGNNKGGNSKQIINDKIKENVTISQKGNQSSNFKDHLSKENELVGKWNDTNQAHNSVNYPKLKGELNSQNLNYIVKQDPRLAAVINGDNGKVNYGIGTGLMSADGTRIYRYPAEKKRSTYASTGIQANFEMFKINPTTGDRDRVGNGHLDIIQ
ncbi:hemagglutinin repeat-containing protein [Proteus alimentorum]|uniref:hemagglutinin repeat-containing protein n=1 Tax=Proteus alimentorum TaxID=1973495 RepID=UPI003B8322FA